MKTYSLKRNNSTGLTLIETLVAISVLMIGLAGALTLAQQSLSSAAHAKDQIVAYYLAQEGMELVRNKRDQNFVNGGDWLSGLQPCLDSSGCLIDSFDLDIFNCTGVCSLLRHDQYTGMYGYNTGWAETTFRRTIKMSDVSQEEKLVTVTIDWQTGRANKSFEVSEVLKMWYVQ
jgi:hypothetical protein